MAVSELYTCNRCQYDAVLVHAQEWQPGTTSQPARAYLGSGDVGGLWNLLWCPTCRAVHPHVFVRLEPPATHPVVAYAEAQRIKATGEETGPCPVCMAALTWHVEGEACPSCEAGHLHFTGEWEDAV